MTKKELLQYIDALRADVEQHGDEVPLPPWFWFHHLGFENEELETRLRRIEAGLARLLERSASCRFSSEQAEGVARLILGVGAGARAEASMFLRDMLVGASEITICDPYLLVPYRDQTASVYVAALIEVLPQQLRRLEIFTKPRTRNREVAALLMAACRQRGIRIEARRTDVLHDRVWVADHDRAYAVGTSFNGLGARCAFILPLPDEDRQDFLRHLRDLRSTTTRSKS